MTTSLTRVLRSTVALISLSSSVAWADGTETALVVTGALTAVVAVVLFFLVFVLDGNIDPIVAFTGRLWAYVAATSPEKTVQFDEDFDGISELDNRIPPWFNYLFGSTVVFAFAYFLNYHVLNGAALPAEEYAQEVAAADLFRRVRLASEGEINEAQLAALADEASLTSGREKFTKNCVSCHGAKGEGLIGPNLTDAYWIHGGTVQSVYATVKNGVPTKGMISWKLVFTPKEIQQIASYILSLQGTNPPNAKKPEGVLVAAKPAEADSAKVVSRP